MSKVELRMPKMGESMTEATIINWLKEPGDVVTIDETILEVATDKVDSEVPAPANGVLLEVFCKAEDVMKVDAVLAIIDTSQGTTASVSPKKGAAETLSESTETTEIKANELKTLANSSGKFLSPLVKNIAKMEGVSAEELSKILCTGSNGRMRKSDLMKYLSNRPEGGQKGAIKETIDQASSIVTTPNYLGGEQKIIKMDRMRQMIADHMVFSKHTSPHVTAFVEADVTNLVQWRNRHKNEFLKKHGEKLTFTPIFIEAVTKAIADFPLINVSIKDKEIIVHPDIHIGMATALPTGNLIVPVVRHTNQKTLLGIAKDVNSLANKARNNKLSPDEVQGSTFTISNVGTFGSLMGTPIINQPEVAILAIGIIKKRAEVLETENGDVIAIRHMMYLSLSFDHRAVDGHLGGSFLKRIADYLEGFDHSE